MQNSLKLLQNIADYEDRKLQLEGLKNRLEAIASPTIVQAFNSNNTGISFLNIIYFTHPCKQPPDIKMSVLIHYDLNEI